MGLKILKVTLLLLKAEKSTSLIVFYLTLVKPNYKSSKMKKDSTQNSPTDPKTPETTENSSNIDRRKFIKVAGAGALAFSIVPRFVLGKGYVPPSDKLTLA